MVCNLLKLFKKVTNVVSGSKYSTSNLYFQEMWSVKKVLDKETSSQKSNYCIYGDINEDKVGEILKNLIIPVILDPRFNLELLSFA